MAKNENEISYKGKLSCDKKILLSIISLATEEINGVSALKDNFVSKVKNVFRKNKFPGIQVHFNPNGFLVVDISFTIENGFSVPDVAFRVQENVKNNIASMVDMKTAKVNVHVLGVDFIEEKKFGDEQLWEEMQGKVLLK